MLGKIVRQTINAPYVELSEYGRNLCDAIDYADEHNAQIAVVNYIVMPNHAHLLVVIDGASGTVGDGASGTVGDGASGTVGDGASGKPRPTNALIPKLISSIKRYTNKQAGFDMWQTSYHDHIIRNKADYQRIWQYIDENPSKWDEDCYFNPKEKTDETK